MQPFAIRTVNPGQPNQVQVIDPLSSEVIEIMKNRKPYYLSVPLVWDAPRTIGDEISLATQERNFNLLIFGARSSLNYSTLRLRNETDDFFYSNDYVPFYAVTGGSAGDRQLWEWHSWIYLPANTQLVISAKLGPTVPGGGVAEADSEIVFECAVIRKQ